MFETEVYLITIIALQIAHLIVRAGILYVHWRRYQGDQ